MALLFAAALAALVFVVFWQTRYHGFLGYDDRAYVADNAGVTGGVTLQAIRRAFTQKELGLWTPMVTVSHMVGWQFFGADAGRHHLANVAIHLASVLILFGVLRGMTGALWRSALVAALFAIHPLRVESVAWLAERKDVLSGLFFMLTLWAYIRYVRRPDSFGWYAAVVVVFAFGLLSKPMLVTLPCVLLLLDYWPLARLFVPGSHGPVWRNIRWRAVWEKIPLLLLSAALCAGILWAGDDGTDRELLQKSLEKYLVPLPIRLQEAPVAFLAYLGKMVYPTNLVFIYPRSEETVHWWPVAAALLASLSLIIFLLRKKHPYLWMGWLWNMAMIVPVSGIVQISRHWMADHYTYLPQIGLYIGLTWLVADWTGEVPRRRILAGVLAGAWVAALAIASFHLTSAWRDDLSLWTQAATHTPRDFIYRANLPEKSIQSMQREEAILHSRDKMRGEPPAAKERNELGALLLEQGREEEAMREFQKALAIDPACSGAHNNIGIVLSGQGKTGDAIIHFLEAAKIDPADPEVRYNIGKTLFHSGQTEEAVAWYREAIKLSPQDAEMRKSLSVALRACGQAEEAIAETRRALEFQPDHIPAKMSLAWMLATVPQDSLRDGEGAIRLAGEANNATGGRNPEVLRVLAAAQAEMGDFSRAILTAKKALSEADGELAASLRRELARYEAGQPVREE